MVYMILMAWSGSPALPQGAAMMAMGTAGASGAPWSLLTVALAVVLFGLGALAFGRTLRPALPQYPGPGGTMSAAMMEQHGPTPGDTTQGASALVAAQQGAVHPSRVLAPRSVMVCQLVMSIVMGYMLLSLV